MTALALPAVREPRGGSWPVVVAIFAALAAGTAASMALVVVKDAHDAALVDVVWLCCWLSFAVVGALVLRERPDHRAAQAFLVLGTLVPVAGLVDELAFVVADHAGEGAEAVAYLRLAQDVAFSAGLALVVCILFLLPDGRLARRWMRWPARATFVAAALQPLTSLLHPGPIGEDLPVNNPLGISGSDSFFTLLEGVSAAILLAGGLVGLLSILMRARGSAGTVRAQLAWLGVSVVIVVGVNLLAPVLSALGVTVPETAGALIAAASVVVIPTCVAIAVLRHNLFDVELLLRQSVLYTVLSAAVVGLYLALATALGQTVEGGASSALLGATAALVALPLRNVCQRWLDRRFYGSAADPYGVLAGLGKQLTEAVQAEDVPQLVADSIREALRLPWAAVELGSHADPVGVAESGDRPRWEPSVVPLLVHGVEVGRLLVAPRGPREPLQERDWRLLLDLADRVAVAVDGLRLTRELQRSRGMLVAAREEERRRLRNDLHDGLGPVLAGVLLQLGLARENAPHEPRLEAAERQLGGAVGDLRRLVYGLRPPALDELGLVGALREHVASLDGGVEISFTAGDLPDLSAAVEVAAYRVATEALTNVLRHAGASRCEVQVSGEGALHVVVRDNGRGNHGPAGVGLRSMRERCAEVGGQCEIRQDRQGTVVEAWLPLELAHA